MKNTTTNIVYEFTLPPECANFDEYFITENGDYNEKWLEDNNKSDVYITTGTGGVSIHDDAYYDIGEIGEDFENHPINNHIYTYNTDIGGEPT